MFTAPIILSSNLVPEAQDAHCPIPAGHPAGEPVLSSQVRRLQALAVVS
jgi:hypothetical protein